MMLLRPTDAAWYGVQDFRRIRAWQDARALTAKIYSATATFPPAERFGLTAQMRTAAVSIGANLAEGCGRATRADTLRFFQMSFGSATELLHHLIIAADLGFVPQDTYLELDQHLESVRRQIAGFMRRLRTGPRSGPPSTYRPAEGRPPST